VEVLAVAHITRQIDDLLQRSGSSLDPLWAQERFLGIGDQALKCEPPAGSFVTRNATIAANVRTGPRQGNEFTDLVENTIRVDRFLRLVPAKGPGLSVDLGLDPLPHGRRPPPVEVPQHLPHPLLVQRGQLCHELRAVHSFCGHGR